MDVPANNANPTDKLDLNLSGLKILLIDDDTFLLDMYALKFKRFGAEPVAASGAEEALDRLADGFVPDIVLCDVIMPKLDGFDFLRAFREKNYAPNATVIVLSNQGQETDQEQAAEFKIDDYIVKALLTPSEVVARVASTHFKKRGSR
jgi:two-component system response regulator ResD